MTCNALPGLPLAPCPATRLLRGHLRFHSCARARAVEGVAQVLSCVSADLHTPQTIASFRRIVQTWVVCEQGQSSCSVTHQRRTGKVGCLRELPTRPLTVPCSLLRKAVAAFAHAYTCTRTHLLFVLNGHGVLLAVQVKTSTEQWRVGPSGNVTFTTGPATGSSKVRARGCRTSNIVANAAQRFFSQISTPRVAHRPLAGCSFCSLVTKAIGPARPLLCQRQIQPPSIRHPT